MIRSLDVYDEFNLNLSPYEKHYLNQGLHFEIEKADNRDIKQILEILYGNRDIYMKKFIVNHIRKTSCFDWNIVKLDLYKNIEKEINETFNKSEN